MRLPERPPIAAFVWSLAAIAAAAGLYSSGPAAAPGSATSRSPEQLEPPCDRDYGSPEARREIQRAMLEGDAGDVRAAIDAAKSLRGRSLGCPQLAYGPRQAIDTTTPRLADLERAWQSYVRGIGELDLSCPRTGRELAPIALAAAWAHRLGRFPATSQLEAIAEMYLDQQLSEATADLSESSQLTGDAGIFGYYFAEKKGDPCALRGIAGKGADFMCGRFPHLCPRYDGGSFAGRRFGVRDRSGAPNDWQGDPGGAAFDTGWISILMSEMAGLSSDPAKRKAYAASARRAGGWGLRQPMVTNHNYTAKVIWILADLFARTGEEPFRQGLIDRLERNLVPGILMDRDDDGWVDGHIEPPVRFDQLTPVAQVPGRMWDGHNALPWYHSMNAWALLEAYVTFRDRGEAELAARYRPYVVAMIDNLATEIVTLGPPAVPGTGWTDGPFSILLAISKLAVAEGESRPLWRDAAAALWNSGAFRRRGSHGVNVALYLSHALDAPYSPARPLPPAP